MKTISDAPTWVTQEQYQRMEQLLGQGWPLATVFQRVGVEVR